MTQQLVDERNFIHIQPIRAIMSLDTIASDKAHDLYSWAMAVQSFRTDTKFDVFFDQNRAYYDRILSKIKPLDIKKCVGFTLSYFKGNGMDLNLYICPFAGNYGFVQSGRAHVVRCLPYNRDENIAAAHSANFIGGIAHEYAHCFVDPVVEKYKERLDTYNGFFDAHTNMWSCYNVNYAVMNEYYVRAYTRRYIEIFKEDFTDSFFMTYNQNEEEVFPYIDSFVRSLRDYEKSDMSFEDFYLDHLPEIGALK